MFVRDLCCKTYYKFCNHIPLNYGRNTILYIFLVYFLTIKRLYKKKKKNHLWLLSYINGQAGVLLIIQKFAFRPLKR